MLVRLVYNATVYNLDHSRTSRVVCVCMWIPNNDNKKNLKKIKNTSLSHDVRARTFSRVKSPRYACVRLLFRVVFWTAKRACGRPCPETQIFQETRKHVFFLFTINRVSSSDGCSYSVSIEPLSSSSFSDRYKTIPIILVSKYSLYFFRQSKGWGGMI